MTENKTRIIASMEIQEDVLKLRIENEQLKKQIEKMKNCVNCNNYCQRKDRSCVGCHRYSHWKLAE